MIAVFDTNIVIDALNGVSEADAEYGRYERVMISRVTWMEVLVGAGRRMMTLNCATFSKRVLRSFRWT